MINPSVLTAVLSVGYSEQRLWRICANSTAGMSAEFTRNFCWYVQLRFSPNPQPHISRYRNDLQYFSQLVDSRPTQRHRRCLLAEDVCTPCRGFGMVNGNKRRPRIKRLKLRLLASLSVCSRQTNKQHNLRSNCN